MKLALVLGASSEKVKPRLQSVRDNLSIDCYKSIPLFIDASLKRELIYDRVLVLSTLVTSSTLEDLHKFWDKYCRGTDVVVVCRAGTDEDLAKNILETFVSTSVTVMLVKSTTVQVMAEGVLLSINELSERYGVKDYLSLETDDGFEFSSPEEKDKNSDSDIKEEPTKVEKKDDKQPKTKKSLLGALFGKKKHGQVVQAQVQEKPDLTEALEPSDSSLDTQAFKDSDNDLPEEKEDNSSDFDYTDSSDLTEEKSEEKENNSSDFDYTADSFDESMEDDTENFDESSPSDSTETDTVAEPISQDDADGSTVTDEKQDIDVETPVVPAPSEIKNDFEPGMVDMDFGDTFIVSDTDKKEVEFNYQRTEVNDVGMFDDNLAQTEEAYRHQAEKPVIVEKEVVKEIVRHVGGTVNTALSGVLSGKLHKTIVVTGDRGSGVTLAAYNIARKFAEKVPVLYVDCDTERHGLLSYIDYDTFRSYDDAQRDSINRCRDSRAFSSCVCQFDVNLDLLTSDYCYDSNDSAIELMQAVVTENQMEYGVVVVDCPISKLHLVSDLILTGNVVVCTEGTKRGIMNMLCSIESSPLSTRYKRSIVSKGTMLITKLSSKVKPENVIAYGGSIFEADSCDWLSMTYKVFNGKLTKDILETILEG